MSQVNDVVEKAVMKKVVAQLDLDAMAKQLAPIVREEVMAGIKRAVKDIAWDELVSDALYIRRAAVNGLILKALGIPLAPKQKKRT